MKIAYVNKFSHTRIGHTYKYFRLLRSLYGGDELDEHPAWLAVRERVAGSAGQAHSHFREMVGLVLHGGYDAVVIPGDSWPMWRYCHGAGIPYVLLEEDIESWRMGEESLEEREMIEGARAIVFTSEDHLAYCEQRYALPPHCVVHLRPLRADLDFAPLAKLPGKTLVYAGGLVPTWGERRELFGYRAYHAIFAAAIAAGWKVHVYNPYWTHDAETQGRYLEYEGIGVVPHRAVENSDLYRELSQYTAGLHGYNTIDVPPAAADYVKSCRPNKCWEYLAAGIPTIGVWPGNSGAIFDGKWGTVVKFGGLRGLVDALRRIELPEISDATRYEQTMDQDIPRIRAVLDPILT